jgi:tetratricopeptide (TPR) repeat protein
MVSTLIAMMTMGSAVQEAPQTQQQRLDAIWSAADARMSQQLDVWFDDGEFPSCIQLLHVRNDLQPHDYEIATDLGWMLENVEQNDKAILVYEEFLKENPHDADAALPVAQHYFLKKQYAKVLPILEPRIKTNSHPNNFRILAHSYERLGRLKDSERMWKRYLQLTPDDGPAKVNLARVQKKIKEAGTTPKL